MKTKMLALAAMTVASLSVQAQLFNWTLTVVGDSQRSGSGSGTLTLAGNGTVSNMTGTYTTGQLKYDAFGSGRLPIINGVQGLSWYFSRDGGLNYGYASQIDTQYIYFSYTTFPNPGLALATFTYTPVPEPHEYAMVAGASLVGLALWRRRARGTERA